MGTFYGITPRGDGYNYLGIDKNNNYVLVHKDKGNTKGKKIVFKDKKIAKRYIKEKLDSKLYRVEEFWNTDRFICPNCENPVVIQHMIKQENSESKYTEFIVSCIDCNSNWKLFLDIEGNLIKIEKYDFE